MTADPSEQPPPTLEYATPRRLVAQADVDQHVQNLIAQGTGPEGIRRYFKRDRDAIQYYCEVMSSLHRAESPGNHCVDCGSEAQQQAIELRWRVELRVRAFRFHLTGQIGKALATWYSICVPCERSWRRNLRWDCLRKGVIVLFMAIVVANLLGLAARGFMLLEKSTGNRLLSILFFPVLFVTIAVASWCTRRAIQSLRPKRLRQLMPESVRFVEIGDTQSVPIGPFSESVEKNV